jgi:4-hydroxybenzoate polyprenyltransferase
MKKIRLIKHIKGYIDLIRPFTLLAPIIVSVCIMIASLFYNSRANGFFDVWWITVIQASIALAILNGASNALNQVTDVKADKISKPYRPIPRGDLTPDEAKIVSLILYITAFSLSFLINWMFTIFVLLIAIFTITYSIPPRIKNILFLNQLWIGVPRGLLGILASWSVFGNALDPLPISIGLIAMSFLIGGSITKDIIDSEADKKTGTHTLVNTYGVKKAALIALPFMFFPFVFIPLLIDSGILHPYLWLLTFLAIPGYFIFHLMVKGEKKGGLTENTSSWTLMYITYFIFAFSFSALTILSCINT